MNSVAMRIATIEDDPSVRADLETYLTHMDGFESVLMADSVESFLSEIGEHPFPEVIMMDVGLPGMSGIEGTRLIKEQHPQVDIVMLTVHEDPERIFEALCAGASGYLLKSTPFSELSDQLVMLRDGGAPMSPRIAYQVIQFFRPKKKKKSPLTQREHEIVEALVEGLCYKEIGERLFISMGTVNSHIKNIYGKLHVHSKAELMRLHYDGGI